MTMQNLPNNPQGFVLTWRLKECEAALTGNMLIPVGIGIIVFVVGAFVLRRVYIKNIPKIYSFELKLILENRVLFSKKF